MQICPPQEIFDRPASPFVADFMGFSTFLHGRAGGLPQKGKRPILCGERTLWVAQEETQGLDEGEECLLALRSESMTLVEARWENAFPGRIENMTYKGHTIQLEVSGCFDEPVFPALGEIPGSKEGDEVLVHFPCQKICVYKAENN